MRISDWSSDVCSSDLFGVNLNPVRTVSFDFALYNTTVKGFQYNINTSLGNVITNVKVRTRGIDTSLNWRPFPGARLQGGVVYADAINVDEFAGTPAGTRAVRSEEHTSELQSLMRISYAVFCLKKKKK